MGIKRSTFSGYGPNHTSQMTFQFQKNLVDFSVVSYSGLTFVGNDGSAAFSNPGKEVIDGFYNLFIGTGSASPDVYVAADNATFPPDAQMKLEMGEFPCE